jgi:predicted secreted protein
MKIQRLIFAALILTAMSLNMLAGEYAKLNFIGFSKDGRYLAFEDSGEWDASGQFFSNTYFIDVEKNSYALLPVIIDDFTEPWGGEKKFAARDRNLRAKKAANLRKLGIVRGNLSELVVAHLLTDWSSIKPEQSESATATPDGVISKSILMPSYAGAFFGGSYDGETEKVIFNDYLNPNSPNITQYYELTLKTIQAKVSADSPHPDDTYKFELSLIDRTGIPTLIDGTHLEEIKPQILQKDDVLPPSRNYPYGYRIERVYMHDNKIAVFLNVFIRGFEGMSMRYMVVTGKFR